MRKRSIRGSKEPKGLGHAIHCAKSFIGNEPFAVLLGDDIVDAEKPCLLQMMELYEQYETSIFGVQQVDRADVDKYGIVDGIEAGDRLYRVHGLVEKPCAEDASSNVAVLGRYIINPVIFDILEYIEPGKGGEIQWRGKWVGMCGGSMCLLRTNDQWNAHPIERI